MKNKRLLILLAAFILALFGITKRGGPVVYAFFWLVVLLPVMCFLYIFYVISYLRIYQVADGRNMVSGMPSDFYITLQNEGIFSFSSVSVIFYSAFSTISEISRSAVYELPPRSAIRKKSRLVCHYRGQYHVGIEKIVVKDFLGLFCVTWKIKEPLEVIVAPARIRVDRLLSMEMYVSAQRDALQKRSNPGITVRDYIPGDEMRMIHWNASAASGKLMVREQTGEEKDTVGIFIGSERCSEKMREYLPVENKIVETVLALSGYYRENSIPVDVYYRPQGLEKITVIDETGYEMLYDAMVRFVFRSVPGMYKDVASLCARGGLADYKLIIFVLQKWGRDEIAFFESLNTGYASIVVYLIDDGSIDVENQVSDRRITVIRIGTKALLGEVL